MAAGHLGWHGRAGRGARPVASCPNGTENGGGP